MPAEDDLTMTGAHYDPQRHHRRSIRLKGYDYTQIGAYFVTACTWERECVFGEIANGDVQLNAYGRVAATMWERIPRHSPHAQLDEWVVMPNHVHGIIIIVRDCTGDAFPSARSGAPGVAHLEPPIASATSIVECVAPAGPPSGSLGAIVGNFKSVTTRRINQMRKTPGVPVWQRNYYERIIRNDRALDGIRRYIHDNPARWEMDGTGDAFPADVLGLAGASMGEPTALTDGALRECAGPTG